MIFVIQEQHFYEPEPFPEHGDIYLEDGVNIQNEKYVRYMRTDGSLYDLVFSTDGTRYRIELGSNSKELCHA